MKQYVLICDEKDVEMVKYSTGGLVKFLEIQGMPVQENQFHALVTPTPPEAPAC